MQGLQIQSLIGELRSHMSQGQQTEHKQQKQYCNKFNKDFKNGPHQRKKNFFKSVFKHFVPSNE